MAKKPVDPFSLSAEQILAFLSKNRPLFPELEAARSNIAALRSSPAARAVLEETEPRMADLAHIPLATYTKASLFALTGDREQFEDPYFSKRGMLSLAQRCVPYLCGPDAQGEEDFDDLHKLFGAMCCLAELQQAVPGLSKTERPLKLVLDRRPFI